MKKLLLLAVFIFTANVALSQWEADKRLTNDQARSYVSGASQKNIASDGDIVHIVWQEARDKNWEIYYKRSTDGGVTWEADMRLTDDFSTSDFPSISVSGSVVHVVWQDERDGNTEIYYKRSTDAGLTWGADMRLTDALTDSYEPSVGASGSSVHIAWYDYRDGNPEIYYKRSTDGGVTWEADVRLTNDTAASYFASVSATGSLVHVIWSEYRDIGVDKPEEIYYKRSSDGGSTWGADTRLTNADGWSDFPCVSASGLDVHAVWYDDRDGDGGFQIYYKRSADGGITWDAEKSISSPTDYSVYASVSSSGSLVNVIWDGNYDLHYKRSTDGGISWGLDARLTNTKTIACPSVSASGSVVHVVWEDGRDGNAEIYYKRNPTGNTVGIDELRVSDSDISIYPNPFSDNTSIEFDVATTSSVDIKIFNQTGEYIQMINRENCQTGRNSIQWNCLDNKNQPVPSGIYYCEVRFEDQMLIKKMIVVK